MLMQMQSKIDRVTVTPSEPRKVVVGIVNTLPAVVNAFRRTLLGMMKTPSMIQTRYSENGVGPIRYEKSKCHFEYRVDPVLYDKTLIDKLSGVPVDQHDAIREEFAGLDGRRCFFKNDDGGPAAFDFTIVHGDEGASPIHLFGDAVGSVLRRVRAFKLDLERLKIGGSGSGSGDELRVQMSSKDEDLVIIVRDEDDTLGNLVTTLMRSDQSEMVVEYEVPKPNERVVVFKLKTPDGAFGSSSALLERFIEAIQPRVIDELEAFDKEWAAALV